jgi:aldose sugar dehydrogenase
LYFNESPNEEDRTDYCPKIIYCEGGNHPKGNRLSNVNRGVQADGRGGILRITQDGELVELTILRNQHPLDMYYAYGIRNSFGIDFDPETDNLWDTGNGPGFGDEINLVEPGSNSGWS